MKKASKSGKLARQDQSTKKTKGKSTKTSKKESTGTYVPFSDNDNLRYVVVRSDFSEDVFKPEELGFHLPSAIQYFVDKAESLEKGMVSLSLIDKKSKSVIVLDMFFAIDTTNDSKVNIAKEKFKGWISRAKENISKIVKK